MNDKITFGDYELRLTCSACPEQYDVYYQGDYTGYLRLRHGFFRADFPSCGAKTVYEAATIGDGIFDQSERMFHLLRAVAAIDAARIDSVKDGRFTNKEA